MNWNLISSLVAQFQHQLDESMLIYLDANLGEVVGLSARAFDGLNNLALSAKEGKHVLLGAPRTLSLLLRYPQLNQTCKDVFRRVSQTFHTWAGLQANVSVWINVSANATITPTAELKNKTRVIEVHPEFFDDSSKVQPSVILAENRDDGLVLDIMARWYLDQVRFGPCKRCSDIRLGGGSTIEPELAALAGINKPVICVVDSDRRYPSDGLGGTANSVQAFKDLNMFPLVEVIETIGRDMENALPDLFFTHVYGDDPNHVATTRTVEELSGSEPSVRKHLDLKEGTFISDGFAAPDGHVEREEWEQAIEITIAPKTEVDLAANVCWRAKQCKNIAHCECRLLNGNHDNMLRAFLKAVAFWNSSELRRVMASADLEEWVRLGRKVFDWTCAAPVLRS